MTIAAFVAVSSIKLPERLSHLPASKQTGGCSGVFGPGALWSALPAAQAERYVIFFVPFNHVSFAIG